MSWSECHKRKFLEDGFKSLQMFPVTLFITLAFGELFFLFSLNVSFRSWCCYVHFQPVTWHSLRSGGDQNFNHHHLEILTHNSYIKSSITSLFSKVQTKLWISNEQAGPLKDSAQIRTQKWFKISFNKFLSRRKRILQGAGLFFLPIKRYNHCYHIYLGLTIPNI